MSTRTVTWGDALLVAAVKSPGGLNQTVVRIQRVMGQQIGSRNSFAKLYAMNPSDMKPRDLWRAWLLLTAVGEQPDEWGVDDSVVPAIFAERIPELRQKLCTPWDLNPEPTDYGSGRITQLRRPSNRRDAHGPQRRAA